MADFDKAVVKTLGWEGGESNDPDDRGGHTKYGISKRAHPDVDIASLTIDQAKEIYRTQYWEKCGCHRMGNQDHAEVIFDIAVNMGVAAAREILSAASQDKTDPLIAKMALHRISRYARIVTKNRTQGKFLLGWLNRTLNLVGVK
jgi:lysozyme family protein